MTEGFETIEEQQAISGTLTHFELPGWRSAFGVVAGVTARAANQDFALTSERPTGDVLRRWLGLAQSLGPAFGAAVVSRQVHGTAIGTYPEVPSGVLIRDGFDGHVTGQPALLLTVTIADCIPVYLLHPPSGTLGLLHAGWRGVANRILEVGVEQLCAAAGCQPADVVIHCGIGICGNCYEVGPEVLEAVHGNRAPGPATLDLRAALAARASAIGVRRGTISRWCTAHDGGRFYSHRGQQAAAGRMVAYLGRPAA